MSPGVEVQPMSQSARLRLLILAALIVFLAGTAGYRFAAKRDISNVSELRSFLANKMLAEAQHLPWPHLCRPPEPLRQSGEVRLEPAFAGISFDKPVDVVPHPSEPGSWLVALHQGLILRVGDDGSSAPFADLRQQVTAGAQWGLQALALAPDFAATGVLYVAYTGSEPSDVAPGLTSYVARLTSTDSGRTASVDSLEVLLSESQPGPWAPVECLRFGPDGLLYISWGSGATSARADSLRGALLRIDVTQAGHDGRPYGIPSDNVSLDTELRPEIYARGFRTPWRFSFDRETGELWLGDVGQRRFEEINRILPGRHYGWPLFEGSECRGANCELPDREDPVVTHGGAEMCALIGGFVYRGRSMPKRLGQYIYADSCSGSIWAVDLAAPSPAPRLILPGDSTMQVGSFAEDRDGELYVVESTEAGGRQNQVFRLVARQAQPEAAKTPPLSLAQLGCIGSDGFDDPPFGMLRYQLRAPAWADGARASIFGVGRFKRFYGPQETPRPGTPGLFLKTLSRDERPIETQMLVQRSDATWDAYSYAWNEAGDDALPVQRSEVRQLADGSHWSFRTEDCLGCHSATNQVLLGVTLAQLDVAIGSGETSQLDQLVADGVFHGTIPDGVQPMADWRDESLALNTRARSYLHVHCAPCHRPTGRGAHAGFDLRRSVPLEATGACSVEPGEANRETQGETIATPQPGTLRGAALLERMHSDGPMAMPPGRQRVDPVGVALLEQWLATLEACGDDAPAAP